MKNKLLISCVIIVLGILAFGTISASADKEGIIYYSVSNGEATISDCAAAASGDIIIPSTLGGYPVTSIGYSAFSDCTSLTSVTIPDSVTSIGNYAFSYCESLTSVTIPDSVTSVGERAFYNCTSLTNINVDENNQYFSSDERGVLFNKDKTTLVQYPIGKSTTSYSIPDSVTSIGSSAFYGCESLTSVTIGNSVTNIGNYAFDGCASLTSVTIPDGVKSIGEWAFYNCKSLTSVNITDIAAWCNISFSDSYSNPLLYAKNLYLNGELVTDLVIPEGVTSIGSSAFSYYESLTSVTIPDSVTSIGDEAFYYCTSLTSITIPDSVTSIGDEAFYNCTSLTSITIPDSVTSIGDYAFENCTSLTSVNITDIAAWCNISFSSYNSNPLYYAKKLYLNGELVTDLVIPEGVTNIGNYAFEYCHSLTSVTIPDSVTSIDNYVFSDCRSLTSVTIPDSVTSIGEYAFRYCTSLTSVTIPDSVTSIGNYALSDCTSLTSVTIGNSVTNIGMNAFDGCASLTSITIPDSVTSIDNYVFSDCRSLTSVTIPDSVTSIGSHAFRYCTSLTSIAIPDSVKIIVSSVFAHCHSLSSVTIPDSVTSIGMNAFYYCYNLTSVTIPDSVKSIGDYAFMHCTNLKTVYYSGTADKWNKISIGSDNSSLTSANREYVALVKIVYENGKEVSFAHVPGNAIDTSYIPQKQYYTTVLYKDENRTEKISVDTPISESTTLYLVYEPILYTHIFRDENGAVIKTESVPYDTVITPPEAPIKENTPEYTYTFVGWDGFTEGMVQSDNELIFTATYTVVKNKYTYVFTDDDGTVLKSEKAEYGTVVTPPEAPSDKDPYTFDYWAGFVDGMNLTENIEFVAVYKYKTYEIDVDGYDISASAVYADKFEIEPVYREDYNFIGYFTEENGNGTRLTDESGASVEAYEFVGNITVYPWFEHSLLGQAEIAEDTDIEIGESFNIKPSFATDVSAQYIYMTVGIPDGFAVRELTPIDFAEISPDIEEHKNGYTYFTYLGIYDYNGAEIPKNQRVVPFEMVIDCSTSVVKGDYLITLSDVSLIDNNGEFIPFENVNGATVTVKAKLAESITISGPSSIDKPTSFTATVYPDYTSNKEVLWSVSDETVAEINENGLLTPIKNGTVIVSATAADGSGCVASKSVEIIKYAEITSLSSDVGMWDKAFSPDVYEYTIAVFGDVSSITLTPTFTGGVLRPNGTGLWISGTKKSFALGEDTTTITLVRQNVTDNADSTYTINVVKAKSEFDGAQIRTDDPQGLRFIFSIPRAIYDMLEHPKSPDDKGIGFGSVVMPKKYLGDNELTKETEVTLNGRVYKSKIAPAVNLFDVTEDEVKFTACLIEIPEKNYEEEYVAVPYMTYMENGEEITIYGEKTEGVTVFTIAEMAYADSTVSDDVKKYLFDNILTVVRPDKYHKDESYDYRIVLTAKTITDEDGKEKNIYTVLNITNAATASDIETVKGLATPAGGTIVLMNEEGKIAKEASIGTTYVEDKMFKATFNGGYEEANKFLEIGDGNTYVITDDTTFLYYTSTSVYQMADEDILTVEDNSYEGLEEATSFTLYIVADEIDDKNTDDSIKTVKTIVVTK